MLTTLAINNRSLPYGSIITRILRHFRVPLSEMVYVETKRIRGEAITRISFHMRNKEWVKMTISKNWDILIAQRMIECLMISILLISSLTLNLELDLKIHKELQQHMPRSQRNKRDMTLILISPQLLRHLWFVRILFNNCLVRFDRSPSSNNCFRFSLLLFRFSSSAPLISNDSFWMANSVFSSLFTFHLLAPPI